MYRCGAPCIGLFSKNGNITHFSFIADLSNDSFSTINMGLDDGTSQHSGRGSYIHSSGSPPPYLSSRSPNPMGPGHPYNSYSENIVYTPMIGKWSLLTVDTNRALQWTFFFLNLQPHLEVPFWARIGAPART